MLHLLLIISVFLTALQAVAQPTDVPVFTSGEEGHKSYRIPAIISLPNGDLLAFAEGRVHGAADFGDVNIVLKHSSDKGTTWSRLQTVIDYDSLQAGNAAPVVDLTDPLYPKGRIFLFYNTGNAHEHEVRSGKGLREVWYVTSTDNGQTWSAPVNITAQVHRPKMPSAHPAYNFEEDWRSYANTPGHAIQFAEGQYKGRIFVAANHSAGPPRHNFEDYAAHGFYTDTHGKTFKLSEAVPEPGSNEATAAELSKGRLLLNSRNQQGDVRARIVSVSNDGGATWDSTYFDKQLPDPVNQGSILRVGKKNGQAILAFSNAADTQHRDNLTLRISFDEGRTWPRKFVIAKSPNGEKDYAAYSDLVKTGKKEIGVLYEKNGYAQIVFTTLNWKK
ncbi:glycoside hydrolase [Pontibacter sp. E15-1]|uniref:sialidase family protein n=1 Tax=Pontibacter sp. E15-1 TaxID=2919918 RepID=UPI001F4F79E8|nr:sialidase family protein [Pontibacter sp. E15-1]MCJ8165696.1 glycoside hydrolase [Pontibacter sp. E15-1]